MKPGIIYLYAGKIEDWTKDWKEEKNRESICGRLLLLRGLQELGYDQLFPKNKDPEQLLEALAASLEKGPYGKPYLAEYPEIHFNISHSGEWAVCALASIALRGGHSGKTVHKIPENGGKNHERQRAAADPGGRGWHRRVYQTLDL